MRLDPPAQLHEVDHLRVGQGRSRPLLDHRVNDHVVAHSVDVAADEPGNQRLAQPPRRLDGGEPPVRRHRISGEQDSGHLGRDHLLHDDRHAHVPVVEAVAPPVRHGPLAEQRRPAPPDVMQDRRRADDVQVRVVLAGEGRTRQVFRGPARAHRERSLVTEPAQ